MLFVFAAGGTGGHIFPAIAVAQALLETYPDSEILFIGVGTEIEQRLIEQAGFAHQTIPFVPVAGGGLKGGLRLILALPRALCRAFSLYRAHTPAAVIGFGGYPAVIPLLAAWIKRIPRMLHEQNAEVGLANRLLSLFVNQVYAVNGAEGFWTKKLVHRMSNPVRRVFDEIPLWSRPAEGESLRVLVVGGSQGAVSLNKAVLQLIPLFEELSLEIVHQSGKLDYERLEQAYKNSGFQRVRVVAFIDDMAREYSKAHLVICRAGAMTAAEVTAAARPAIYVPLRIARGHQAKNVRHLVAQGAARMIEQGPDLHEELAQHLRELCAEPEKLERMANFAKESSGKSEERAAQRIAQAVYQLGQGAVP